MSIEDMTNQQKIDWIAWLFQYPALTVMIFLRRKVGFRQLKPLKLFIMMCVLIWGPGIIAALSMGVAKVQEEGSLWMKGFGVVMLATGLVQRYLRWRDIRHGARWHTYSRGVSYFEFLPIRQDLVYRIVDPLVCFGIGWGISDTVSQGLGSWVMFCAVTLAFLENYSYDKQLEYALDTLDSLVESEVQTQLVQHFADGQEAQKQVHSLKKTAGIPTGLGPDIERLLAKRQKPPSTEIVTPMPQQRRTAPPPEPHLEPPPAPVRNPSLVSRIQENLAAQQRASGSHNSPQADGESFDRA